MISEACREELYIFNTAGRFKRFRSLKAYGRAVSTSFIPANETPSLIRSEMSRKPTREYLVEGFVTQSTQLYEVGKAEHPILDDEAQQLGERVQKTLYVCRGGDDSLVARMLDMYFTNLSGLTRVAFVVGIFSKQMIILKLESIWH